VNQRRLIVAEGDLASVRNTVSPNTLRANISETGLVLLVNEQKGEKEEIRDARESSWCCSFPWGFGCRGTLDASLLIWSYISRATYLCVKG
jgi:hypothetical protein